MLKEDENRIVFLGSYPPRECGIATFTQDLSEAIGQASFGYFKPVVCAMNDDNINIYNYSKKVVLEINEKDRKDYAETARKINENDSIKLVSIQHEFGIFGGEYGDYLIDFLEELNKPVIVTFHSVLPSPNEELRKVVNNISKKASGIVVMTQVGEDILRNDYGLNNNIYIIPHGIPTVPFERQNREKRRRGLQGRKILSSFGMLGPGKGYENVIEALPKIVEKFPEILYLIIGETHPGVRKKEGEKYRNGLQERVRELGLEKNVNFYNNYLELGEILRFLKATDVYLSTSENPNQITSGTLAYAAGCGRAVISTPFLHAKDLLKDGRGILTKFGNPESFEKAIISIFEDEEFRKNAEETNYFYTRHMTWPNVALSYHKIFRKHMNLPEHPEIRRLPRINISHLRRMTDNFGIIQFSNQANPDISSGYTLDDNARAMLVCVMCHEKFGEFRQLKLIKTYLDYVKYVQDKEGKLFNYVNRHRQVNFDEWSSDAHGRALWALGYLISSKGMPRDLKREAENIMIKALAFSDFDSPRSNSFSISGIYYYSKNKRSQILIDHIRNYADRLVDQYKNASHEQWKWFEPVLTYANSKIPEALFYSYLATKDNKYLEVARESLEFLISKTFNEGVFVPIGQRGWYMRDKERSYYDQQPIDAAYTVQTLLLAYNITNENRYEELAVNAFLWFLGKNSLGQVVYNKHTGGCHDGIGQRSINLNQGAESAISYLLARFSLREI